VHVAGRDVWDVHGASLMKVIGVGRLHGDTAVNYFFFFCRDGGTGAGVLRRAEQTHRGNGDHVIHVVTPAPYTDVQTEGLIDGMSCDSQPRTVWPTLCTTDHSHPHWRHC
jgi:hypothetical protein